MKRCIVNVFSEGRENYVAGTKRLINSLKDVGYIGDILVWSPLIKDYVISTFLPQNITLHQYEGWGVMKNMVNVNLIKKLITNLNLIQCSLLGNKVMTK